MHDDGPVDQGTDHVVDFLSYGDHATTSAAFRQFQPVLFKMNRAEHSTQALRAGRRLFVLINHELRNLPFAPDR